MTRGFRERLFDGLVDRWEVDDDGEVRARNGRVLSCHLNYRMSAAVGGMCVDMMVEYTQ